MIILPSRNGMLLRNSNGIIASDCGGEAPFSCPCKLLTGTKCSCFNTNQTPSAYVVEIEGKGKFCLKYISECTWSVTIGTTVVTLNLTYNTNMARLHVYHNSVLVFNAYSPVTTCYNRLQGFLNNAQVSDDWGDALYYPACIEPRNCNLLRLVKVEIDFGRDFILASGSYGSYAYSTKEIPQHHIAFGYLNNVCQLSGVERNIASVAHKFDCSTGASEYYPPEIHLSYSHINGDADYVTIQYGGVGVSTLFYAWNWRIGANLALVPSGDKFVVPNTKDLPTDNKLFPSCAEYDYNEAPGSYNPQPVGGTATITVY